jgi:hypothetical protein
MSKLREAAQQLLEDWDSPNMYVRRDSYEALRAALSAPATTDEREVFEKWVFEDSARTISQDYGDPRVCAAWDAWSARAALPAPAVPQWLPIETAPLEGVFLVYMPTDTRQPIQVAKWGRKIRVIGNVFDFDAKPPTHWHPLPAAPQPQEQT